MLDIYYSAFFRRMTSQSMPVQLAPYIQHPHKKTEVKYITITYLPLKDNIQLFPIPGTEDVYPVAELLL